MRKQVGGTQASKITMRRAKLGEHDRGGDRVAVVEGDCVGWGVAHGDPLPNSDERGSVALSLATAAADPLAGRSNEHILIQVSGSAPTNQKQEGERSTCMIILQRDGELS